MIRAITYLQSTHITIDYHSTSSRITIRPVNTLSKIFSLPSIPKFFLSITLIYPILWLIRYFILGAEIAVIRVGYPLVYWSKTNDSEVGKNHREWLDCNVEMIRNACQAGLIGSL